ncbi:LysR family transcriptional regulator MleR [Streptococcus mutans]|uniref:LysR family transcriptional regulator MleR n=1 Tax=Streptococcus mutans TaxID=1309 RepID=UPI0028EE6FAC|nr:LysR family transcriptional regulator MleR [Streptococcus mutans]MDT9553365.1 LysR family transcriptional regulator MleR [Streptococcus mutans]MDT9573306.1 LysR family transcriptional regulator MleR [Streptococcus mutans]
MNIKDLKYFYHLSQLQSFTKVAEKFQISQPSVSYSVKRLEEQFNCDLIVKDPSHRTFALTQQGNILKRHLERILPEISSAQKEMNRSLAHYSTLGCPPIIINYLLSLLKETNQDLAFLKRIRSIRGGSVELLEQLLQGDLDLSLIGTIEPFYHDELVIKKILHRKLYLIVSKDHLLAKRKKAIAFADVLKENFILLDEHNIHLKAFDYLNQTHQNQAQMFFKSDDVTLIKQMVSHNMGVSLLTDISLTKQDHHLVKIPFKENNKLGFYVNYAYLKSSTLTPDIRHLVDLLDKIAQSF